jgi:phospholipid/cholesterol/gamma-HCH transport system ATP-binding protein
VVISHDVEIFKYVDNIALLYHGKIVSVVDAATVWESTDPYIYQFIRGLTEGPIHQEIPDDKNKM